MYIARSYFLNCLDEYGGAIYFSLSSEDCRTLIETSLFKNCSVIYHGGAIYMDDGDCTLNKVCGEICLCSDSGAFLYKESSLYSTSNIKVETASFSYCNAGYYATLFCSHGAHFCTLCNFSYNYCHRYSAIFSETSHEENDFGFSLALSSIMYNEAVHLSMELYGNENKNMENTNIVGNIISDTCSCGILRTDGYLDMRHCSFIDNIAKNFVINSNYGVSAYNCTFGPNQLLTSGIFSQYDIPSISFTNDLPLIECITLPKRGTMDRTRLFNKHKMKLKCQLYV